MPIEKDIAQELGIKWIDARDLATEARIELGLSELPTDSDDDKENYFKVKSKAIDIFNSKPQEERNKLVEKSKQSKEKAKKQTEEQHRKEEELRKNTGAVSNAEGVGILALLCCCIRRAGD